VSSPFDSMSVDRAKEELFGTPAAARPPHSELIESWRRSQLALGRPENVTEIPHVPDEVLDLYLLDLLQAPLNRFAEDLEGTGLGLLLADARGQVIQRWSYDRTALAHLDQVGTVRGSVLAESSVGTNGIGTVLVTGKSVQISGNEHFAEVYRNAICTGAPLRHPISGKLMGAVTLSSEVIPRSDLLRPLLKSLTTQLEQHVLELAQPAARRMFDVFLKYTRVNQGPVVAFGPQGALIQSTAAGRLTSEDLEQIHQAVTGRHAAGRVNLELSAGSTDLEFTSLDAGNTVVVIDQAASTPTVRTISVKPRTPLAGRSPEWLAAAHQLAKLRQGSMPVLISGEPGVGKVSLALGHPFQPGDADSDAVLDAADSVRQGGREWLQLVAGRLDRAETTVIRGIDTLDTPVYDGLRSLLTKSAPRGTLIMTMTTRKPEGADETRRRFGASGIWLPPLRERFSDIAVLWSSFARSLTPQVGLEPTPDSVALMRKYSWPGNTRELRSVINELAAAGKRGSVTPADLPPEMNTSKSLSMIERVELDALRNALNEAGGNRAKAAEILGLSRATVYRKMKAYRLQLVD
jgi:transcriptional regulator of acetoin/glycerol metabolism